MDASVVFRFSLQDPPTSTLRLVNGGVDSDRDGDIDSKKESLAFKKSRDAFEWRATMTVPEPTQGMQFAFSFTVGAGIRWRLEVTKVVGAAAGPRTVRLYDESDQTVYAMESLQAEFAR